MYVDCMTECNEARHNIYTDETYSSHVCYPDPLDLVYVKVQYSIIKLWTTIYVDEGFSITIQLN